MPAQPGQVGVPGIAANDTLWPSGHAGSNGPMTPAPVAETRHLAVADECRSATRTAILLARWSFEVAEWSAVDPRVAPPSALAAGLKQTPERHSILSALLRALAEWRTRDADRRCMSVLDDHILTDIGFARDEANRPVWQPSGRC